MVACALGNEHPTGLKAAAHGATASANQLVHGAIADHADAAAANAIANAQASAILSEIDATSRAERLKVEARQTYLRLTPQQVGQYTETHLISPYTDHVISPIRVIA